MAKLRESLSETKIPRNFSDPSDTTRESGAVADLTAHVAQCARCAKALNVAHLGEFCAAKLCAKGFALFECGKAARRVERAAERAGSAS